LAREDAAVSVLDDILAATREECVRLRRALPPDAGHTPVDVAALLRRNGGPLRLIAEIKKRSPSAGALSTKLSVAERAHVYASEGATMISVLVDAAHFDGGYHDLAAARASTPLLAKGFAIDTVQVEAARRAGADAILLIVRILDDASLRDLVAAARGCNLCPVVEVIDDHELERALEADAEVIGVNARDLSTLAIDRDRAARVRAAIPPENVSLWFSGVATAEEVRAIAATTADGALIGEALMRRDDPRELLRAMVAATR
jgi:indole-3-glycerol phosphate synthase